VPKPAIFAVQMLFFGAHNQKNLSAQYRLLPPYGVSFAALWHKFCHSTNFCHLMAQILPPYGASFAALWPSTNKQSAVQNPGSKFWVCLWLRLAK
jgi:hypothetical protein